MSEHLSNSEINYDIYFLKKIRWILFFLIFFALIIISNIPILKKLDSIIYGSLQFGNCKVNISNYEINLFPLPHLNFQNVSLPGQCTGAGAITLKEIQVYFRGPSFSPFGPHFKVETNLKGNPLSFFISSNFTLSKIKLLMQENSIDLAKLSSFMPKVKMNGIFKTDALVELNQFRLQELNLNLQSNTFNLPSQNIQGFALMPMNIKNVHLIAQSTNGQKLEVKKLVIGDESSPIRSEMSGTMNLNQKNIMASTLNLAGQLAIADSIIEDPSMFILKNYMTQFDKRDNFYQIKIIGALGFPEIRSR